MGNAYYEKFRYPLAYWGAWSTDQAAYYLQHFHGVEKNRAKPIVEYLCTSYYLFHIQGREDIVGLSEMEGDVFSKGREKCVWMFFDILDQIIKENHDNKARPRLLSKNVFSGIDYTYDFVYYSLVYVSPNDFTYYNVLKQRFDNTAVIIFVTDSEEAASKIKKVNDHDQIWYIEQTGNNVSITEYLGETK